MSNSVDMIW